MKPCMLSTSDNPYNPFTHFKEWYMFDSFHHYKSCELLGRFLVTSDYLSPNENEKAKEQAISTIIEFVPTFTENVERIRVYPDTKMGAHTEE